MNSECDPIELNKFQQMSADWWDPKGSCRILHALNPIRLQFIDDRCNLNQKSVLDIGCGGGILSESMAKRGAYVTGIDAEATLIHVAKQHAEESSHHVPLSPHASDCLKQIQYLQTTAENYARTYGTKFDVITCLELLEHVPDPVSVIKAAASLIKPTGHLFFSTLNRTPRSYLFAIVGAEYLLKILPYGTHRYQKFIKPSELEAACRQAGLKFIELSGLNYNPLTHQCKLSTDLAVNYLAHIKQDFEII